MSTGTVAERGRNRFVVVFKTIDITMLHLLIALTATGIITTHHAEAHLAANASSRISERNQNWTSPTSLRCNSSAAVYVISASSHHQFSSCHQQQRQQQQLQLRDIQWPPLSSFLAANLTVRSKKSPETNYSQSVAPQNSTRRRSRITQNRYNLFLLQRILSQATWESVNRKCFTQINILVNAMDDKEAWALKGNKS